MTSETASRTDVEALFAGIGAHNAASVAALLDRDPDLANARSPKGTSAALASLFLMKDKEGFLRPQENPILKMVLDRRPSLDSFEAAAFAEVSRVRTEIARDSGYVTKRHSLGWTPLHFAAFAGNEPAARALIEAGADINARASNKFANSPLQVTMLTQQVDVAKLLIRQGADVNAKQEGGFTALHEAVQAGSLPLVVALLDAGADPHAAADDGRTPLDIARHDGAVDLVARLSAH